MYVKRRFVQVVSGRKRVTVWNIQEDCSVFSVKKAELL